MLSVWHVYVRVCMGAKAEQRHPTFLKDLHLGQVRRGSIRVGVRRFSAAKRCEISRPSATEQTPALFKREQVPACVLSKQKMEEKRRNSRGIYLVLSQQIRRRRHLKQTRGDRFMAAILHYHQSGPITK